MSLDIAPVSRKVGEFAPQVAGAWANDWIGKLWETFKANSAIEPGTFVRKSDDYEQVEHINSAGDLVTGTAIGLALYSHEPNYAGDDYNIPKNYASGDLVSVATLGYCWMKIDPNNRPTNSSTAIRISYADELFGYLTTNATNSKAVTSGVRILRVDSANDIAEVFISNVPLVIA